MNNINMFINITYTYIHLYSNPLVVHLLFPLFIYFIRTKNTTNDHLYIYICVYIHNKTPQMRGFIGFF